jgi:hypothetical protein
MAGSGKFGRCVCWGFPSKSASSLIRRRLVHSRRDQSRWATSDLLAQDGTDPPAKPQSSTGAVTHRQAGPDFESKFFRRQPDQIALPPALLRAYLLLRQRRHCHGCEVGIEPIKGFTMVNVASRSPKSPTGSSKKRWKSRLNRDGARAAAPPVLDLNDSTSQRGGRPLYCGISTRLMSAWGQKLLLPQCKSNGRFTSVSGHKGRRSWMMRALRILDSPLCADSRYPSRLSG